MYIYNENAVLYGERLFSIIENISHLRQRTQVADILSFLRGNSFGRISALFGCRYTGKTTAMLQAIEALSDDERRKTAFIQGSQAMKMSNVVADIIQLRRHGFKNVFIDEATWINGFGAEAASLDAPDLHGMKILLSGTNSLLLHEIFRSVFSGRGIRIPTSWIPFGEWSSVLGIPSLQAFLQNGGTMFPNFTGPDENVEQYVLSSLTQNICESVKFAPWIPQELIRCHEDKILVPILNHLVKTVGHNLVAHHARIHLAASPLPETAAALAWVQARLETGDDRRRIMDSIAHAINIRFGHPVDDIPVLDRELQKYLDSLTASLLEIDFIRPWPCRYFSVETGEEIQDAEDQKYLLIQPGLRYRQSLAILDTMRRSGMPADRKVFAGMQNGLLGNVLEEQLFNEILFAVNSKKFEVFKILFLKERPYPMHRSSKYDHDGEIDIAVRDIDSGKTLLFECKITETIKQKFTKNILNEKYIDIIKNHNIIPVDRFLIGSMQSENNSNYKCINAEQWLSVLWKEPLLDDLLDGKSDKF